MTQATIVYRKGSIIGYIIEGHTGYANIGSDILCAAISTVCQATAKGIVEVIEAVCDLKVESGYFMLEVYGDDNIKQSQVLLETMKLVLEELASSYKQYLQVNRVELPDGQDMRK